MQDLPALYHHGLVQAGFYATCMSLIDLLDFLQSLYFEITANSLSASELLNLRTSPALLYIQSIIDSMMQCRISWEVIGVKTLANDGVTLNNGLEDM